MYPKHYSAAVILDIFHNYHLPLVDTPLYPVYSYADQTHIVAECVWPSARTSFDVVALLPFSKGEPEFVLSLQTPKSDIATLFPSLDTSLSSSLASDGLGLSSPGCVLSSPPFLAPSEQDEGSDSDYEYDFPDYNYTRPGPPHVYDFHLWPDAHRDAYIRAASDDVIIFTGYPFKRPYYPPTDMHSYTLSELSWLLHVPWHYDFLLIATQFLFGIKMPNKEAWLTVDLYLASCQHYAKLGKVLLPITTAANGNDMEACFLWGNYDSFVSHAEVLPPPSFPVLEKEVSKEINEIFKDPETSVPTPGPDVVKKVSKKQRKKNKILKDHETSLLTFSAGKQRLCPTFRLDYSTKRSAKHLNVYKPPRVKSDTKRFTCSCGLSGDVRVTSPYVGISDAVYLRDLRCDCGRVLF